MGAGFDVWSPLYSRAPSVDLHVCLVALHLCLLSICPPQYFCLFPVKESSSLPRFLGAQEQLHLRVINTKNPVRIIP